MLQDLEKEAGGMNLLMEQVEFWENAVQEELLGEGGDMLHNFLLSEQQQQLSYEKDIDLQIQEAQFISELEDKNYGQVRPFSIADEFDLKALHYF